MTLAVVSAVITAPQLALAHYRHAVAGVVGGVLWWLVLALALRFVISWRTTSGGGSRIEPR
jgi:hypothetical protein